MLECLVTTGSAPPFVKLSENLSEIRLTVKGPLCDKISGGIKEEKRKQERKNRKKKETSG